MSKARDGVEDLKTIDANLAAKAPIASPSFTGNVGVAGEQIKLTGSSSQTYVAALNTGSGEATFYMDASNGDLAGSDYAWIKQKNNLDVEIGSAASTNRHFLFSPDGTEKMRLFGDGTLQIGKQHSVAGGFVCGFFPTGSTNNIVLNFNKDTTSGSPIMLFNVNGSQKGSINTTNSATVYSTSSDYRLKTDVQPLTGATAKVKLLKPCNFAWIIDGTRVDGFLAHEAQEVVPAAVTGTKDAMKDEEYQVTPAVVDDAGNETTEPVMGTRNVPDMQGIDQSKLIPLLTATIQELITRIEALEA